MKKWLWLLLLVPVLALAQDAVPAPVNAIAAQIVVALTPVVTLAVVAVARMIATLPGWVTVLLTPVVGFAYGWLVQLLGNPDANVWLQALLGLAAVGLHQIKKQLEKQN